MTGLSDDAVRRLQAVAAWPEFAEPRYSIVEEIGRGGMGTVYLARDEMLDREVAIKVSRGLPAPGGEAALERRVRLEARILARLEHPGIVPIHEVGRLADGRLFYVMKRVRGRTLLELLRDDPPGGDASTRRDREAERLGIFERICDPVAFAHAHGCIHRDLKPENVMVGEFGEVMVMDWGVAKVADPDPRPREQAGDSGGRLTQAGTIVGTPGFMAPEQAGGTSAAVDERADVYGLGAILFMLLTGEAPPSSADEAVTRLQGTAPAFAVVPAALRAICTKALAPDPANRYAGVRALSADIARYRSGQAVDAHRETFLERTERFVRTYRTPILLVLAYMIMRAIVAMIVK